MHRLKGSISIPSKKPERRSSWGPLLTLSRSPGHHESAHQASNILVTVAEHPITPNMQRRASSPHFSNIDHANRARRDIPTTNDLVPRKESFSSSEVIQESQATPKMEIDEPPGAFPVSKGQAFEDPFTSTPIAEKETFQSQDIPNSQIIQPSVSEHHDNPLGQLSPRESDLATSPRSSGDTRFYSVPEGSPDLNEWVVVSPAHDTSYFAPLQESNESHVDDLSRQSTARAENVEERSMVSLQPDHDNLDSLGEPNPNHPFTGSLDPEVTALPSNTAASELIPEDTTATVSPELGNSDSVRSIALMGSHQDAVSPESDLNDTPLSGQPNAPSVNITSMSILNRPRGNTIEDPLASSSRSPVHYTLSSNVGYASSQPAVLKTPRERQQEQSNSSFLPPIRRTSTFGIGFGSRQKQRRFPIDDDDEHITGNEQPQQQTGIEYATSPGSVTPREYGIDTPLQQQDASIMQQAYVAHSSPTKPRVVRVGSSDYSQHKAPQQPNSQQFAAHRPYDVQPRPTNNSRHSQDSRRANGNSVDMTQAQRNAPWAGSNLQNRPFEQPPSSAQRYPGLFRSDTGSEMPDREHDLPAHYYQQPIAREEAFLPRQQISEYEIPGVGPPTDLPQTGSSRNSGRFFRELSGRLSRGTSRERNGSNSRGGSVSSPQRPIESNGNGNVESSMILEEGKGQSSRRANLFGNLERASTVALGNLQSRESVSAHHSGLRTDLLSSGQESPIQDQKKRSFFGSSSTSQTKLKTSKLSRSSTSGMLDGPGKKRRFSGLTGFFGKAENSAPRSSMPPPTRSPGSRQFGYNERPVDQPSQSSRFISNDGLQNWTARKQGSPPNQETPVRGRRGPSRSGGLLSKLTSNSSSGMQESQISDGSQKENKSRGRRPSTSGLLNGIIGRKAQPYERDGEESRSQGSQPRTAALPLAQTYTDMEEQQPLEQIRQYHQSRPHTTEQSYQARGRDRHVIREPQYDSVPIPGGYSLVRPQGAMVVPTSYDPKGLRSSLRSDTGFRSQSSSPPQQFPPQQSYSSPDNSKDDYNEYPQHSQDKQHGNAIYDARSSQSNRSLRQRRTSEVNLGSQYHQQEPRFEQVPSQQEHKLKVNDQSQPLRSLAPLETSQTHSPRYLSSEEELACSPAKTPEDQQRPYQISLPGSSDTEHRPAPIEKDHIYDSHNTKPSRNSIQRLQHGQPVLQHPASPAEYPIPDSALSPVNPQARDFPPPPPPTGWESQSSYLNPRYQPPNSPLSSHHNANLSVDLERSNTRRTAVSAVSQVSHMSGNDEPPRGRSSISAADEKDLGGNVSAESSRGPSSRDSPVMSPEGFVSSVSAAPDNSRGRSGERGILREHGTGDNIPTTTLNHNPIPDDLYDASPPLPNQGLTLLSRTTPKPSPIQTSFDNTQIHPQNAPISNTHLAPNDHLQNKQTSFPEEKIHYNSHSHSRTGSETRYHEMDAEPTVTMSATSYPGQEWNPYAGYEGLD
ncbi:hypothetical protein HYALB_00005897 [Hymenoscyphus albidus]|uniref:Uncharacterized protein n=1 Tax=Hymenoscyphus albidus TaxID=595503 RepID=A0A9N9LTF0_9HELO|nr:hypothetical protein HYALB_00005897 [Hymenoscyphus albidus]